MSHVAFATCDNLSLECKVHTSSSASRPLLYHPFSKARLQNTLVVSAGTTLAWAWESFAGSIKPGNFLVYMVAMPPQLLRRSHRSANSLPLSTHPLGALYIRNEKRDINSIVFAQRCPVFHFPAPIFDALVFHSLPNLVSICLTCHP
jgi:hypothetical protein